MPRIKIKNLPEKRFEVQRYFQFINSFTQNLYFTLIFTTVAVISFSRILLIPLIQVNWDAPIIIDGAYRLYLGQTIHNDFSSPTGLLNLFPGAVGMEIFGPNLLGLNLGMSLFSLILTLVLTSLSLIVVSRLQAFLLSITISLFLASPATLSSKDYFSYTSTYNMAAYAVLTFICVTLSGFHSLTTSKKSRETFRINTAIGFAIALLVFIKFPIALISLLPFTIHLVFHPGSKLRVLRIVISSFSITIVFFLLSFKISLEAIFRDFGIVIDSRNDFISQSTVQVSRYFAHSNKFLLAALVILYLPSVLKRGNRLRNITLITTAFVIDLAVQVTIQQPAEIVLPLILSIPLVSERFTNPGRRNVLSKVSVIALFFPLLLFTYNNGFHYVSTASHKIFSEKPFQGLRNVGIESIYENERKFDSAMSKFVNRNTKLVAVGCNDSYSVKYSLQHAIDTPLYWHDGVTFSEAALRANNFFNPESIFQEVNLVGISYSCPHGDSAKLFEQYYLKYLEVNFKVMGTTPDYTIWEKTD